MPYFRHEGINIYYEAAGEGPSLLLVNGLAGDARQWGPLIGRIRSSFLAISYDMRCAGRSDKPDKPFSIEDLAYEARGLLCHLGCRDAYVLGFSMGGMVAMSLALRYPEAVGKLFLAATAPSLTRPHPPSNAAMSLLRRTDVSPALLTEVYESIFGDAYRKKVSARDFINFRLNDDNPQPAFAYLRQLGALESCDLYEDAKKISVPAVIIAGSEDAMIPPANSVWLADNLKGSTLHTLKGIGHMVPAEAADRLADLLVSHK